MGFEDKAKLLLDKLFERVEELNNTRSGLCWVCHEGVDNWGILLPESASDDLGFGSRDKSTARIVFFPICTTHDIDDDEIIKIIRKQLLIKKQEFSN